MCVNGIPGSVIETTVPVIVVAEKTALKMAHMLPLAFASEWPEIPDGLIGAFYNGILESIEFIALAMEEAHERLPLDVEWGFE